MKTQSYTLPYGTAKSLTEIGRKGQYNSETKTMEITFDTCERPEQVDCDIVFDTAAYTVPVTELETIWIDCSRRSLERYWVIRFFSHPDGFVSAKILLATKSSGQWAAQKA